MQIDFTGDGRRKLHPPEGALGAEPMSVTRATARHLVSLFEKRGSSTHSRMCGTLWIILAHCEQEKVSFKLEYWPGMGAVVTRVPPVPSIERPYSL
jgi:hypothetical protein